MWWGGSSNASSNTSGTGGGSCVTPPAALATAAYGGNWKDVCGMGGSLFTNSANIQLNEQYFVAITPTSDTTISMVETVEHFAPADTSCTGTPAVIQTTAARVFTVAGTVTIGGQVVDKLTFLGDPATISLASGAITLTGSSLTANTVSINGYSTGSAWLAGNNTPGKILLRATPTAIYCGGNTTQSPATGYPTAMKAFACLNKI